MGVRGLQTYLEKYCPDACYRVHLPTIIADYRSKHNGQLAEIVVDAQSCFRMWCEGLDWTIGTETQEIIERLRMFIEAFTNIGAKLTFFTGGSTPEKKRETWITRRIDSMNKMFEIFDIFYRGQTYRDVPPELDSIPLNMGFLVATVLKYVFKCPIFKSDDECDEEIIEYAHANHSFAIFGQDTDFVISDVDCLVLSSKNFDISELTTLVYDREKLSSNLGIRLDQLPLFAILVGNDLFRQELLRPFHAELCKRDQRRFIPYQVLMPAVGKYISELPDVPVDDLLKIVCYDVFNNYSRLNEMKVSYESYLIHQKPDEIPARDKWSRILHVALNRMKVCEFPSANHTILKHCTFESSMAMEDFRRINDQKTNSRDLPSATVLRPIRLRLYGILLFEQRYQRPWVTEWCGENLQSYQRPLMVEPEYPKTYHPGLLAMWDDNRAEKHADHKWTLFLKAVSPTIVNIGAWSSFNEELIVPVAACYYLLEAKYISMWELHAILATIAVTPLYDCTRLRTLDVGCPSVRAIQMSVTFLRACGCVFWLISACGCYLPMSERIAFVNFEAKLFQIVYRKAERRVGFDELCERNESCMKTFSEMMNLIQLPTNRPTNSNWRNKGNQSTSNSNFAAFQNARGNSFPSKSQFGHLSPLVTNFATYCRKNLKQLDFLFFIFLFLFNFFYRIPPLELREPYISAPLWEKSEHLPC